MCIEAQSTSSVLCRLSRGLLKDAKLVQSSVLLFCVNPASVFMSSIYTEPLFLLLSILGLLALQAGQAFQAAAWFGIAGASRSNGMAAHAKLKL